MMVWDADSWEGDFDSPDYDSFSDKQYGFDSWEEESSAADKEKTIWQEDNYSQMNLSHSADDWTERSQRANEIYRSLSNARLSYDLFGESSGRGILGDSIADWQRLDIGEAVVRNESWAHFFDDLFDS